MQIILAWSPIATKTIHLIHKLQWSHVKDKLATVACEKRCFARGSSLRTCRRPKEGARNRQVTPSCIIVFSKMILNASTGSSVRAPRLRRWNLSPPLLHNVRSTTSSRRLGKLIGPLDHMRGEFSGWHEVRNTPRSRLSVSTLRRSVSPNTLWALTTVKHGRSRRRRLPRLMYVENLSTLLKYHVWRNLFSPRLSRMPSSVASMRRRRPFLALISPRRTLPRTSLISSSLITLLELLTLSSLRLSIPATSRRLASCSLVMVSLLVLKPTS